MLAWRTCLLCLSAVLVACSSAPQQPQAEPVVSAQTLVFECSALDFVVIEQGETAMIYLPRGERELLRERSASGSAYRHDEISLRLKGTQARLEWGSETYADCQLNRRRIPWEEARRRGVDFRAVGQEPGWVLEMQHDQQTLLVFDYGARRLLTQTPDPDVSEQVTRYSAAVSGETLTIEVRVQHCQDTMSGEVFDNQVEVLLGESAYSGCGLKLESDW